MRQAFVGLIKSHLKASFRQFSFTRLSQVLSPSVYRSFTFFALYLLKSVALNTWTENGDECAVLLERLLAENNRLREAMEARDDENQPLLKKLCTKLDGENADPVMPRTKNNRKEPGTSLFLNIVRKQGLILGVFSVVSIKRELTVLKNHITLFLFFSSGLILL